MTGAKLLVVDDEQILRIGASWTLREVGFEVDEASDGLVALELVKKHNYSTVLMDLNMPNMDGFECASKLRQWEMQNRPYSRKLIIIALSSAEGPDLVAHCLRAGMNDYLTKSCTKEQLRAVVIRHSDSAMPHQRALTELPKI